MSNIQLRGNCPCCGNEQAVKPNGMSAHGYTKDFGYFHGICGGHNQRPMQEQRTVTEDLVAVVLEDIANIKIEVAKLEEGTITPKLAKSGERVLVESKNSWGETRKRWEAEMIPFADAKDYYQKEAVADLVRERNYRVREGERFVEHIIAVLDKVHGTALIEIDKTPKAVVQVKVGERRKLDNGRVLEAVSVEGARVYWIGVESGRKSWTGKTAWKRLEMV